MNRYGYPCLFWEYLPILLSGEEIDLVVALWVSVSTSVRLSPNKGRQGRTSQ